LPIYGVSTTHVKVPLAFFPGMHNSDFEVGAAGTSVYEET
jgi:hypothetical protein